MSVKVKAIVIGGTNVKEKDRIVQLFTLENGKMSVSMKGVRGDKAKLKSAKELFCFGDFIIEEGKSVNVVTSVDVLDNFYAITGDISKYYEACAIVDIVSKIAVEPNPALFVETLKALKTLCYDNVKKYYVIDKFLISIFRGMGYDFITDKCSNCGGKLDARYFNLDIGEIVCPACKTNLCIPISNPCYSAVKIFNNTEYEKLTSINLGGSGEIQAFDLLSQNYYWRTNYNILKII